MSITDEKHVTILTIMETSIEVACLKVTYNEGLMKPPQKPGKQRIADRKQIEVIFLYGKQMGQPFFDLFT